MNNQMYPAAVIKNHFEPKGISNIIQAVGDEEILYLKARSEEQLSFLLRTHLKKNFRGLLVSPYQPDQNEFEHLNYLVMELDAIDKEIEAKTDEFYPLEKGYVPIFGVTGTNGKTSTCWLFSELMKQSDKTVLYLGTMGTFLSGEKKEDKIITTTPSRLELRKIYSKYSKNVDYIAIEVSSHALAQKRVGDLKLDVAAWTNFTQDHLDFHKTMDEYFTAKMLIKDLVKDGKVIVLEEEKQIRKALGEHALVSCEAHLPCASHYLGQGFILKNMKIALSATGLMGINIDQIDFSQIKLPPGRFEVIEHVERNFIVDYAHTPDALDKLLTQAKNTFSGQESYIIFGCGGDRDRTKRSLMGRVADNSGFNIIVTSDNPRTEDPEQIIEDVARGIGREHLKIVSRKEAIETAYKQSSPGDVIIVAGKGHEDYQEIQGQRYHFSDQEVIRTIHD